MRISITNLKGFVVLFLLLGKWEWNINWEMGSKVFQMENKGISESRWGIGKIKGKIVPKGKNQRVVGMMD